MDPGKLIRSTNNECRLYIGNLPQDVRNRDVEDIFYKYGHIAAIDIHNRYSPAFAFVEFEDPRDAKDAVHGRDGYDFDGYRIRVEFPRGSSNRDRSGEFGRRNDSGRGRSRGSGPPRRSDYRVLISGLPPSGSWQDLKDHMREAGDVLYSEVFKDGTGVVEFARKDDMKWAIKNLDDTKFKSHESETSFVRVKLDEPRGRSKSRSFSPSRVYTRHSSSRSPRRSRSKSRSSERRSHSHSRRRSYRSSSRSSDRKSRSRDHSHEKSYNRNRSKSRSRSN